MSANELEVHVVERPGITFCARCNGATASCTSSPATAAKRAASKAAAKAHGVGVLSRAVTPEEIAVRQIGGSQTWIATLPADALRDAAEPSARMGTRLERGGA